MRIKIQQFLFGKNHSWAHVGKSFGKEFLRRGFNVEFISTDGFDEKFCPKEFIPHIKKEPSGKYDLQLSYTAPHNWPKYFDSTLGGKKLAIWNYEYKSKQGVKTPLLPKFSKFHHFVDWILPSSKFSKQVFLDMKIPENKLKIIHHGVNLDDYKNPNHWPLNTKKKRKILLNIAQPHKRKNIPSALEAFGKAFTYNDNVCLIAKVFKKNKGNNCFDVDFNQIYTTFEKKFPKHAEVEFVHSYIENIADIYASCDINFSATHAECFWLPGLEAQACDLINVAPNYGGLLDFCNENNSLLIDVSIKRCPRTEQYWGFNPYAVHAWINTDDASKKLQKAVNEYNSLKEIFSSSIKQTIVNFTWKKVVDDLLELVGK